MLTNHIIYTNIYEFQPALGFHLKAENSSFRECILLLYFTENQIQKRWQSKNKKIDEHFMTYKNK